MDGMGRDGEREIVLRSLPLPLLYSLGRDGQKEGPFAQIRLTPRERYTSFRPSLAPEGGGAGEQCVYGHILDTKCA